MRRRQLIAGVVGAVATSPWMVRAQQGDRVRRIGVLMSLTPDDPSGDGEIAAFRQGLEELGWTDGRNVNVLLRWTGADLDRIRAFAKELIELRPDVLVARSTPPTLALKRETDTIPVVFVNVSEPVGSGLAQTLARPGGNLTGFTSFESSIGGKLLELLKQTDTRITRADIIYNPQTAPYARLFLNSAQSAAPTLWVRIVDLPVQAPSDIETVLALFASEPGGSLVSIRQFYHRTSISDHPARGTLPPPSGLFLPFGRAERRPGGLCRGHPRFDAAGRGLRRPDPQRGQACRATDSTAGAVLTFGQPANGEGARHRVSGDPGRHRGRSDRVVREERVSWCLTHHPDRWQMSPIFNLVGR
jgi:putative ABC transport system substrate-binding protein